LTYPARRAGEEKQPSLAGVIVLWVIFIAAILACFLVK